MTESSSPFLAYYLEQSKAELTPGILDEPAFDRLLHIARQFPAGISNFWGFECRLGEVSKAADFLFEIKKDTPGQLMLSDTVFSESHRRYPIWEQLKAFASRWGTDRSPFCYLRNLWLEFDVSAITSSEDLDRALAHPSLFWGPEPQAEFSQGLLHALNGIVPAFALAAPSVERLISLQATLPQQAQLFQFGVMSSRDWPVMRVCINRIEAHEIVPTLSCLHWDGNIEALKTWIERISTCVKSVALNLDMTSEGIGDKIGLECYLDWAALDVEQWYPLFTLLRRHGLLLPEKQEALLHFPAKKVIPLAGQLKDDETAIVYPSCHQNIHHVKISFSKNEAIEAKAYLGVYRPGLNKQLFTLIGPEGKLQLPDDHWVIP